MNVPSWNGHHAYRRNYAACVMFRGVWEGTKKVRTDECGASRLQEGRVKRKAITATCLSVLLLSTVLPARAITFGQLDAGRHPQVGALVAEFGDPAVVSSFCSGTLISPTVFLRPRTASKRSTPSISIPGG